jgi:hypothetical protein
MVVFSFRFAKVVRWGMGHWAVFDFHWFLVFLVVSSCFAGDTVRWEVRIQDFPPFWTIARLLAIPCIMGCV